MAIRMLKQKRALRGSPARDAFKRRHKDFGALYASDADLCLVSKNPPGIIAYLDYKAPYDSVTFAEVLLYNDWMRRTPVYIVEGADPERGPFLVHRYEGGDWRPDPPKVQLRLVVECPNYEAFITWEEALRRRYERYRGNLVESED